MMTTLTLMNMEDQGLLLIDYDYTHFPNSGPSFKEISYRPATFRNVLNCFLYSSFRD
jgi:hypothetical protein